MNVLITVGCCLLAFVLLLVVLILFLKLKISVMVNNKNIRVYLWKIKVYDSNNKKPKSLEGKIVDKDESFEKKYKGFKYVINTIRRILDDKNDDIVFILKYIKKTFSIKTLDFSLDYGFGDAALTGISGGVIWGVISNISGFIGRFIDIKSFTNIAVKPHYTEKIIDCKVNFVFYLRLLNLIKTYKHIKRFRKTLEGRV